MSRPLPGRLLPRLLLATAVVLPLGGCGYDYLQNTDRVSYSAGNAVKANLESETIDPSRRSMYSTKGLGSGGVAGKAASSGSTTAPASGTTTTSGGTPAVPPT